MTLKGFSSLGNSTVSNDVVENIISFFDYGLFEKGNSIDVPYAYTGVYGDESRLYPVKDERYDYGQVWCTKRPNIVWESGAPSGIYIGANFYNTATTGTYQYYIDHPHGAIFFQNKIPTTSVVRMPHKYKYISVCRANGLPWFKEIETNIERYNSDFVNSSGYYQIPIESRQSLPLIGIELANQSSRPYQLGGGRVIKTDLYLHCIAEDAFMRDSLVDVVTYQADASFYMYDLNLVASANKFPLDYRGVPASGAMTFPLLSTNYTGRKLKIIDVKLDSVYTVGKLMVGSVKLSTELDHIGV